MPGIHAARDKIRGISCCVIGGCVLAMSASRTAAGDDAIHFDVPAAVACCDLTPADCDSASGDRLVCAEFDITLEDRDGVLDQLQELSIAVYPKSAEFQVVDFSPRTLMHSPIEGTIAIEDQDQHDLTLGIDLKGGDGQWASGVARAGAGKKQSTTQRYQRWPEKYALISAGTIHRGSGVFFKLKPSGQTTLEGAHRISITFRVPADWRGGLLRVDCRASARKQWFPGVTDDYVAGNQQFVVALYLEGDSGARQSALTYAKGLSDRVTK
jgi:hypothetical protein